jgi:excinuclease ABC subunit C
VKNSSSGNDRIRQILQTLPDNPGVYQYYDDTGKLLYVGKAKNLKKRVTSYFTKDSSLSGKLAVLVRKIADIRTIVVDTEYDALLLENNLIKKYLPRYNVMLKDDKTYPWICIRNEPFPRIFPTRTVIKDGSQYYGPYASVRTMNNLLDLIRHLFQLRNCNLKLTKSNIESGKFKVCLEYHIGNCKGPCEDKQDEEEYNETINSIRYIIKGNLGDVQKQMKKAMLDFAENMEFEKAQRVKEKLMLLEKYQSRSTVVNPQVHNVDVFTILDDTHTGYVNFMKVIDGSIIQAHTVEIRKKLDETPEQLLLLVIADFRDRYASDAAEILLPFPVDIEIPGTLITVPQKGDKKKLIELSQRNAFYFKSEKEKQKELADPERHSRRILEQMKTDLRLKEPPEYIECFDNSNIQGDQAVSAMVVFRNARPAKSEYRHYNIRTVEGPDDYASMEEVITRRYRRLTEENKPLPQLIIVDGGKGQLSSAVKSLEQLNLLGQMGIIGIAKKLEEIYYPNDQLPMYLDKKSVTLRIIQQMRDEAHRFGITHHRKKREKETIKTELTEIKGIGNTVAEKLLKKFRSVENIRNAPEDELAVTIGKSKAGLVYMHFHPQST